MQHKGSIKKKLFMKEDSNLFYVTKISENRESEDDF